MGSISLVLISVLECLLYILPVSVRFWFSVLLQCGDELVAFSTMNLSDISPPESADPRRAAEIALSDSHFTAAK